MTRVALCVFLCLAIAQVALSDPAPPETPCEELGDLIEQGEQLMDMGSTNLKDLAKTYASLPGKFLPCIQLDPFKTLKCMIETAKECKETIDNAKMTFELMKEGFEDYWTQLKGGVKACMGKK